MIFERTIYISKEEAELINKHLTVEPTCEEECLGGDIAITHTAKFDDGIEIDIKCCGVQYEEGNESNLAWSEAVLFKNGYELSCTEPCDEYLGEWVFVHNNHAYCVCVKIENNGG